MAFITGISRYEQALFSSLDTMIAEDNPVRLLDAFVNYQYRKHPLLFQKIDQKNMHSGRSKYLAIILLKIIYYGIVNGIKSSRRLEKETKRNIELMWLINNLQPDHWTISNFRKENKELIASIKKQTTSFIIENKMITGKRQTIDGVKIKANSSKEYYKTSMLTTLMEQTDEELEKYLSAANSLDSEVEGLEEEISRLKEKAKKLLRKKDRLKEVGEIAKRFNAKYITKTDTEAVMLKGRDGKIPGYNVQVSAENHFIVENEVTTKSNDVESLLPIIEKTEELTGEKIEEINVDKGYYSHDNLVKLEEKGIKEITMAIPQSRGKNTDEKNNMIFTKVEGEDKYICSAGKELVLAQKNVKKRKVISNLYIGTECTECPLREKCTKSKRGRHLFINIHSKLSEKLIRRMQSEEGKVKIKRRKTEVEHIFGTLKMWMGKNPLLLRGKEKVQIEMDLWQTGYNLVRAINLVGVPKLMSWLT